MVVREPMGWKTPRDDGLGLKRIGAAGMTASVLPERRALRHRAREGRRPPHDKLGPRVPDRPGIARLVASGQVGS